MHGFTHAHLPLPPLALGVTPALRGRGAKLGQAAIYSVVLIQDAQGGGRYFCLNLNDLHDLG